jgi:NADH-quinone oxidoreductase subunit E
MQVKEILDKHGRAPENLIGALLEYQNSSAQNYLSEEDLREFAKETNLPISKLYSIATFYSMLSTQKRGKYIIKLCYDIPCYVNDSLSVLAEIEKVLGITIGETTEDGLFTLEYSSCLGCCDISPVMQIADTVYGNLTADKVASILAKLGETQI